MNDVSKHINPDRREKAHRIMEWSNILTVASAALGITAWFTSHPVLFYITGSLALLLALVFMWGPVFIGISGPGQGRIVNGVLFMVIGILITHRAIAGILLGGSFFALFGMLPLAWELHKQRRAVKKTDGAEEEEVFVDTGDRDARINRMSQAFDRLSEVSAVLMENAEHLEDIAGDVDILKEYMVSGDWMKDFEADERGEVDLEVNRSVLSEDGLYNLLEDMEDLMHTFERLQERFAADPELEKKLQEMD